MKNCLKILENIILLHQKIINYLILFVNFIIFIIKLNISRIYR